MNMLKEVIVENFRNSEGNFPSNEECSRCNGLSEVYVEIIKGGPVIRLCKGCLTDCISKIDKAYVDKMSKK